MSSILAQRRQKLLAMKALRSTPHVPVYTRETCPGCGQTFSETKRPPQYGTVICPNCGALVRLNVPGQRL